MRHGLRTSNPRSAPKFHDFRKSFTARSWVEHPTWLNVCPRSSQRRILMWHHFSRRDPGWRDCRRWALRIWCSEAEVRISDLLLLLSILINEGFTIFFSATKIIKEGERNEITRLKSRGMIDLLLGFRKKIRANKKTQVQEKPSF